MPKQHILKEERDEMAKPLSVAVIGAGMAGATHANAWRQATTVFDTNLPPVRLATIADAYLPFAQDAAKRYGYEKATENWRDILDDPSIDVVSIVVGNALHREMAEALVKAGKHVLCEKPLTDKIEDAKALAELEKSASVQTGTAFWYRWSPSIAKAAELAKEGRFGKLVNFTGTYLCDYGCDRNAPLAWRYTGPMGSGALGDVGSHLLNTAELVCGKIKAVSGAGFATVIKERPIVAGAQALQRGKKVQSAQMGPVTNDDVAVFTASFESGVVGSFTCSRVALGHPNSQRFEVYGTDGFAAFDMARAGELVVQTRSDDPDIAGPRVVLANPDFPYFRAGSSMAFGGVGVTQIDQFIYQAHAFLGQVAGVDTGLPAVPSFEAGYRAMRIQEAIVRSANDGGAEVTIR